jgi:ArsR family transcriptional regulator, arsenate/arsenite/antimonite-responsive transcriptional repressor / arsenate reductase (thioredoxin)
MALAAEPPLVLGLAGHPVRWRLLRELALSDRRVGELVASVRESQSLVSYHLRRLRAAGVVAARRSSFDGRDTYYTVDLDRCAVLLAEAGAALHPALGREPAAAGAAPAARPRVLFLCTGNSGRSQMAEALLRELTAGAVEAASAGSHPKPLHPEAVRAMRQRGVDISHQHPTHLEAVAAERFDYVVSLCDRVREVCPRFPGASHVIHWSIADPAAAGEGAFDRAAAELEARIRLLVHRIDHEGEGPRW